MLIIEKKFNFLPLIDTINSEQNLDLILDFIAEYIQDAARRTVLAGESKRILHISGLADYHHTRLFNYLYKQSLQKTYKLDLVRGEFGDTNVKHSWIKIDDFIIDLTIKQFQSLSNTAPSYLRRFFDTQCYISNNTSSLIYNLYHQVHEK